ncbi:MAG: DNA polymerase I [Bacillota bacterium]
MKKIVLIDGNSLANRAFYALPSLTTSDGRRTGAIYGFLTMLFRVLDTEQPDYVACAFDKSAPTFRHREFDLYKAHRKAMPEELRVQMPVLKDVLSAMGIPIVEVEGFEADDVVGTMAKMAGDQGVQAVLFTGDRDVLQLVSGKVLAVLTKKGISEVKKFDEDAVRAEYGVSPAQLVDVKALMGDQSDNIPGVPGIGEKTALRLIKDYGSLEGIRAHIDEISPERVRQLLKEHWESAQLSRRLAAISVDVPLELEVTACTMNIPDTPRLVGLLKDLEFYSLLGRLESLPVDSVAPAEQVEVRKIETSDVPALLERLKAEGAFALLLELEGGEPAGLAMSVGPRTYVARFCGKGVLNEAASLIDQLSPAFRAEVSRNIWTCKDVLRYLISLGLDPGDIQFDPIIAAYLLDPTRNRYRLADLAREMLEFSVPEPEDILGTGKAAVPFSRIKDDVLNTYLGSRVHAVARLLPVLTRRLEDMGLAGLFREVEMPLCRVLAEMEITGVEVDPDGLREIGKELRAVAHRLAARIHTLAGGEFNINSPKQLAEVLFTRLRLPVVKKTKTGPSTDAEVLEQLAEHHEICRDILEYRQVLKLLGTYVEGLTAVINPATGRIHSTFNQTVTSTGRISSSEPNLQNIPIRTELGRRIRKVFRASRGLLLLAADYSQIELRVLAHISGDATLVDSFLNNEDIHTRTASEVFGVSMEQVTREMRRRAKAVNFGIVYGISDFGLSRDLGVPREEARQYIENYFARYCGVKQYIDNVVSQARRDGYVTTLFGRRRPLPDLHAGNIAVRRFAERTAMNTPIQGTAADIIKMAMVRIYRRIKEEGLRARMVLQVHDELIFELPPDELTTVADLVRTEMEGVAELAVPLRADLKVGPNWYDMEELH